MSFAKHPLSEWNGITVDRRKGTTFTSQLKVKHLVDEYVQSRIELNVSVSAYIAALVVFSYDYVLCLSREIEAMWTQPFQISTAIYFITRYLPFSGLIRNVAVSLEHFTSPNQSQPMAICGRVLHFINAMWAVVSVAITCVLIAQTYAMYNQNRSVLVVLGTLGITILGLGCLEAAANKCMVIPIAIKTQARTFALFIILTVFLVAVMALTMYKIFRILRQNRGFAEFMEPTSLPGIIIRESISMLGVAVLRLFNILVIILAPDCVSLIINPLIVPMAAIFVSHFLMNLRSVALRAQSTLTPALTTGIILDIETQRSHPIFGDFALTQVAFLGSRWDAASSQGAAVQHDVELSTSRESRVLTVDPEIPAPARE